jgi:hypothetical protein
MGKKELVIPDDVEVIGENAFPDRNGIERIIIPNTVREIGPRAFQKYTALKEIFISGNATVIGSEAFNGCHALRSVTLSEGVAEIKARAFWFCHSLREITFPGSTVHIGSRAFECCGALTAIRILNPGVYIDEYAFNETPYWDNLMKEAERCAGISGKDHASDTLTLPEGLTHIDIWAFSGSEIRSASLPNSLRTIGMCAFKNCKNLREVSMSANTYCNYRLRLESDDGIFANCTALEQVTFRGKIKDFTWHDAQAPELLRGCDREKTFKGCIRMRRITARDVPLSMIPEQWRSWAVNAFIADIERSRHYSPEIAGEYHEYLRANHWQLLNRTLSGCGYPLYHYLMEQRVITPENFETILQRARAAGSPESVAALLAYQHNEWGQKPFEQQLKKALSDLDSY